MTASLLIATLAAAGPELDAVRLKQIPGRMNEFVRAGTAAGFVTLVAQHGRIVALDAAGYTDLDRKQPMQTDAIFQLHSMTKPVVCLAVLMLAEQGLVRLNDPVELHLPEFRSQWVMESETPLSRSLVRPARAITIRDLMTHGSGMALNPPPAIGELHGALHKTLAEAVAIFAQQPLQFQPGTRWMYSNTGIAALGRIVEVVSGRPFEKFLEERIFVPLEMPDTAIYPAKDKWPRMPTAYVQRDGRPVKYTSDPLGEGVMKFREGARYPLPEGGLYSSARDLFRLYQMFLNGGTLDGVRIVSKASIELMTRNHTGTLPTSQPGAGWGLGWFVRPDGVYGHGGRYGTFVFIDPKNDLFGVFLIHREGGATERQAFENMVYGALANQ